MRPIHYEVESALIKKLIEDRCDFFLGGRGIGIRFYPKVSGFWELEIERARVVIHADELAFWAAYACGVGDTLDMIKETADHI